MLIRERTEAQERELLSLFAMHAADSAGRDRPEEECPIRTCFQRDNDRIIHSKAFRRLKHKTQVFLSPEGDHYRTRLTHTLEVSQIARTIVRAIRLNESLTEAICMGHDLGHTPFGHAGERELAALTEGRFSHNQQSVRVVERIEKNGMGLNLTREVRNGILCHSGDTPADTLEGRVVHLADRIAYINHDIDDAVRAGILRPEQIPNTLGHKHSERINTLVCDVIEASDGNETVGMTPTVEAAMNELREFMFCKVYRTPSALAEEKKVRGLVCALYEYYIKNSDEMPGEYRAIAQAEGLETAVCDYIAGMTDRYAIAVYADRFIPNAWGKI